MKDQYDQKLDSPIVIIGHPNLESEVIKLASEMSDISNKSIIIMDTNVNHVSVNGILYEKIQQPPRKPLPIPLSMGFLTMTQLAYGMPKLRNRPNVNIVKEFELIQNKKSNLSKSNREWVVWKFNRTYKKV